MGRVTHFYLNGEAHPLSGQATVGDLLRALPTTAGCAVARNGEVVPRSAWDATLLEPSDRVEILSVAPGG
jgi:sulfur carrier protein